MPRSLYYVGVASTGGEVDGYTILCTACVAMRRITGDKSHNLGPDAVVVPGSLGRANNDAGECCEDCGKEPPDAYTPAEVAAIVKAHEAGAWDGQREPAPYEVH